MIAFARSTSVKELARARRVLGVGSCSLEGRSESSKVGDLQTLETNPPSRLQQLLIKAGPSGRQILRLQLFFACCMGVGLAALVLTNNPAFLVVCMAGVLFPLFWLKRRIFVRAEAFERDYPAMLLSLSSSIRTGLDPLVALQRTKELFPATSEVGRALAAFCLDIERGLTEENAVRRFGCDVSHPDVRLFQTAFLLARREGSSLAACLQRLVKVTRNRQSFRRKMRTAVAMQKLSAMGIAGCAILIVIIQVVTNVEGIRIAMGHPVGSRMLLGGACLMVIGLLWMMRMAKARI